MSIITLIAAVDENNGLGYKNQLLCHLPADLKHFKEVTMGKPIVMGYATYKSIGRLLPGRLNIILTRKDRIIPGAEVVHDKMAVNNLVHTYPETMIIGGAQIFKLFLTEATQIYLTRIHHKFIADIYFPKIESAHWKCTESIYREPDEKNPYPITFLKYIYENI